MGDLNDVEDEDLEALMQETPVGENHGRRTLIPRPDYWAEDPSWGELPRKSLYAEDNQATLSTHKIHQGDLGLHGLVAHRGILQEDEHVDPEILERMVERMLGVPVCWVQEVFSPGVPSEAAMADKAWLEDRFLELQEAGGNMSLLGSVFGWKVRGDGFCRTMSKALGRARKRRLDEQD